MGFFFFLSEFVFFKRYYCRWTTENMGVWEECTNPWHQVPSLRDYILCGDV